MKFCNIWITGTGVTAALHTQYSEFDRRNYHSGDVIDRDIAVVGGGASGTYAAVNIRDYAKSVVLIEQKALLGGQVNTYTDPNTGVKVDYGVEAFYNNSVTNDYFQRFNTSLVKFSFASNVTTQYADFKTGQLLTNFSASALGTKYFTELDKYPYLNDGFHLPSSVPKDLLIPWKEYIVKYSLQDEAYTTVAQGQGSGDVLESLSINVFKGLNQALQAEIAGAAVTTASHDNSELYTKARIELGSNVLLNSTVIAAQRSANSSEVRLVVHSPAGKKLIIASQLVLGIPPVLKTLRPFSLDKKEENIFGGLTGTPYYCGLVKVTGLPSGIKYQNAGAATPYHVPKLPGAYMLTPTAVHGLYIYWYASIQSQTRKEIEANVAATISKLTNSTGATVPDFVAFANHSPYHLTTTADRIRDGFYDKLYSLQGYRNTWYIGANLVLSAGQLWNNTHAMLPDIVAAAS